MERLHRGTITHGVHTEKKIYITKVFYYTPPDVFTKYNLGFLILKPDYKLLSIKNQQ